MNQQLKFFVYIASNSLVSGPILSITFWYAKVLLVERTHIVSPLSFSLSLSLVFSPYGSNLSCCLNISILKLINIVTTVNVFEYHTVCSIRRSIIIIHVNLWKKYSKCCRSCGRTLKKSLTIKDTRDEPNHYYFQLFL